MIKLYTFIILLFFSFSSPLFAATYYLDCASGDNADSGNEANPWKDLDYAWGSTSGMGAGDTLVIEDGTCKRNLSVQNNSTSTFSPQISGTDNVEGSGLVLIKARNAHQVTLDGEYASAPETNLVWIYRKDYIRFEGIIFANSDGRALYLGDGGSCAGASTVMHHITVYNCIFDNNAHSYSTVINGKEQVYDIKVDRCIFRNNQVSDPDPGQYVWYHVIYTKGTYWQITNNIFHDQYAGHAIKISGNCYGDDDTDHPSSYDSLPTHKIINNTFNAPTYRTSQNFPIVWGAAHFNEGDGPSADGRPRDVLFANNAFYNHAEDYIVKSLNEAWEYDRTDFYNNYSTQSEYGEDDGSACGGTGNYCPSVYSGNSLGQSTSSFGFTNVSTDDYSLTSGSSLISGANASYAPDEDYAGTQRPQGQVDDIGAYEYVPPSGHGYRLEGARVD